MATLSDAEKPAPVKKTTAKKAPAKTTSDTVTIPQEEYRILKTGLERTNQLIAEMGTGLLPDKEAQERGHAMYRKAMTPKPKKYRWKVWDSAIEGAEAHAKVFYSDNVSYESGNAQADLLREYNAQVGRQRTDGTETIQFKPAPETA